MAETLTANYSWTKPDPGASANTWGATLNADLDKIDAQVFANQTAITAGSAPIGSGALWFTSTPPTNWLICDGSSLSTTTYAALFAKIGYTWGGSGANFNLPPLANVFPMGAGTLGATGGEAAHVLAASEMPAHAHGVNDPTHAHSAYQNAHNHTIVTGNHAHGIVTGAHAHGGVAVGLSGPGSGSIAGGVGGGNLQMGNTSTAGNLGGNTDTAGNLGGYTDTQTPGVGIYGAATGVSIQNAGSGAAHNNLPPYLCINFIIRFA